MQIILASNSPRRKELINLINDNVKIIPSSAEEIVPDGIAADATSEYLAVLKAKDVASKNPDNIVIGADTTVLLDETVFGKPKNKQDAKEMLLQLSGKTHKVITGCCIYYNNKHLSFSSTTFVSFYKLNESEIENYIATNEPMDKAGAYGIQGYGALLVKEINGDYFNVVGLPVAELKRKLQLFIKLYEL